MINVEVEQTELNEDCLKVLKEVSEYLKIELKEYHGKVEDAIKALCVAKLCDVIGVNCAYNDKTSFFNFFSSVVGEAVVNNLNIQLTIAPCELRCVRYDGINFITQAKEFLSSFEMEQAFIKIFEFLMHNNHVMKYVDSFNRILPY